MSRKYLKLTPCQELEAKLKFLSGNYTITQLVDHYGCTMNTMCNTVTSKDSEFPKYIKKDAQPIDGKPIPQAIIIKYFNDHGTFTPPSFEERLRVLPSKTVSLFKQLNTTSR